MAANCDFTMHGLRDRLPEAFTKVASGNCKNIIAKVFDQELKCCSEDETLDEIYSEDAEEEYIGGQSNDGESDDFYLEAV